MSDTNKLELTLISSLLVYDYVMLSSDLQVIC